MVGNQGASQLVQTDYRRGQDRCVLLQYPHHWRWRSGTDPVEVVQVSGKNVRIAKGAACWAASWEVGGTGLTIFGPAHQDELLRLMAYVDQKIEGNER